jgi:hypothetical protein
MAGRPALSVESAIRLPVIGLLLWFEFSRSERLHAIVLVLQDLLLIIFLIMTILVLTLSGEGKGPRSVRFEYASQIFR